MFKHNQDGAVNSLLIIIILAILLVAAVAFAGSAFSNENKYKNDDNSLINAAVSKAVAQEITTKNAQFAAEEKDPLNTYNGPEDYGSVVLQYPKTWSGYVASDGSGNSTGLNVYFNPGLVPSTGSTSSVYALQLQVLSQSYTQVLASYQQNRGAVISAYSLPKLPHVVGVKLSGSLSQSQGQETMVILPIRGNTLEVTTDGTQYVNDFNSIILPNLTFSP